MTTPAMGRPSWAVMAPAAISHFPVGAHSVFWTWEADRYREIVAEVLSWSHYYSDDPWLSCGLAVEPYGDEADEPGSGCANDDNRGRCTCGLDARRLRILSPLARGYGIRP